MVRQGPGKQKIGIKETALRKKEKRYAIYISFNDMQIQRWWRRIKQTINERKETMK
jgi:hypothetical protein